jgi:predicted RNase H-like HicB family nuclease
LIESVKGDLRHNLVSGTYSTGEMMTNEFTAVLERDGQWYVAYCPEIPGANGQGKTKDEARVNLADVIALILEDRRQDALRGIPPDAELEIVTVKCNQALCSSTCADMAAI